MFTPHLHTMALQHQADLRREAEAARRSRTRRTGWSLRARRAGTPLRTGGPARPQAGAALPAPC